MQVICVLFGLTMGLAILTLIKAASFELNLKDFDEKAYQEWGVYTVEEKLPYILDAVMKQSFVSEFKKLSQSPAGKNDEVDQIMEVPVTYLTLLNRYSEFLQPEDIEQYMEACDSDRSEEIDLLEYIVCRGEFDAYLSPHGLGEFDTLESVLIHDYEEKRNDPNFRIPGYNYDEDGIIID